MKVRKLLQAGMAALVFGTGLANAAFVPTWLVSDFAFFNASTVTPPGNVLPNPTLGGSCPLASSFGPTIDSLYGNTGLFGANPGGLCTGLEWGTGSPTPSINSSLLLQSLGLKQINTNGPSVDTLDAFHYNNPILTAERASFLRSVEVVALVAIYDPALGVAPPVQAGPLPIQVTFLETNNSGESNGLCANGDVVGSDGAGCRDIFVLQFAQPNFAFTYGGFNYLVDFQGLGSSTLSNEACKAANGGVANDGCQGFLTREAEDNMVSFNVRISTVPEPGSMALVGGALVALGFFGRRRKQKQQG